MAIIYLLVLFLGVGTRAEICSVCKCAFVDVGSAIQPTAKENVEIITFKYRLEGFQAFNPNVTYDRYIDKYFYVDCSSEGNVGQIDNLRWPQLDVLGVLGNFKRSQWKKLEFFPDPVKRRMTVLSVSGNQIADVEPDELNDFGNLKMLNLSENRIATVGKFSFRKLTLLRVLDLSGNGIRSVDGSAFQGTDLEYLNLSRNHLSHVTSDVFHGLTRLRLLDLSQNRLLKLPDDMAGALPELDVLAAWGNLMRELPYLPGRLRKLNLARNKLTSLGLVHETLEALDVSHNDIASLEGTRLSALKVLRAGHNNLTDRLELQSPEVFVLDLSYNQVVAIPEDLTSDRYRSLERLHLDGNPIESVRFPGQGEPFRNLKTITLSNCSIKSLQRDSFTGIFPTNPVHCSNQVEPSLNLSYNFIKTLDEGVFSNFTLCTVDLSKNNLRSLSKDLLPWTEMSHVDLQGNPWQCDCDLQWMLDDFMEFAYEHHPHLLHDLKCAAPRRYKHRPFVFWYNRTHQVFCRPGPSIVFLDFDGGTTIEVWTASAIACIVLASLIVLTTMVIAVLLCMKPGQRRRRDVAGGRKSLNSTRYTPIRRTEKPV